MKANKWNILNKFNLWKVLRVWDSFLGSVMHMYRILKLRLEKIVRIIMSNHQPITTTFTTKPCPQSAESTGFVEDFQGWRLHHFPGSMFQCFTTLSVTLNPSGTTWGHLCRCIKILKMGINKNVKVGTSAVSSDKSHFTGTQEQSEGTGEFHILTK